MLLQHAAASTATERCSNSAVLTDFSIGRLLLIVFSDASSLSAFSSS